MHPTKLSVGISRLSMQELKAIQPLFMARTCQREWSC